jgi:hypothetical protein
MSLTKTGIAERLHADDLADASRVVGAVSARFACGISKTTAARIVADYRAGLIIPRGARPARDYSYTGG